MNGRTIAVLTMTILMIAGCSSGGSDTGQQMTDYERQEMYRAGNAAMIAVATAK